ncbi:CSS-motif domain-containing protein [Pseudomonas sp. TH15]|uniref:CSS-motif domain-containing protein n=1 Tax=Pseudomonas sp. TH15 TaxID=2796381 RepID=UPI001F5BE28A|nr:CSS-motif domain-containing protein [Pseudomonas sp. TH15]
MHRARIIGVSVFLAILSVVVSLGLACYLAWMLAINSTHQRLEALAQIASHQADVTLREASTALKTLAALPLAPCTAEGIDQMRLIALNVHSVKSVGYVEEEVFVCSSWGTVGKHVAPWPEDFTTADGVRVSVNVEPRIAPSKPMMALQYAAFNVLVDPKQFLEVALDDNVKLAIAASSGHLVGASSAGLDKILALFHGGSHAGLADGYLYALVGRGDWIAVAAVSRDEIWSDLRRAEWLLLPFGAITAMLLLIMIWRGPSANCRRWRS